MSKEPVVEAKDINPEIARKLNNIVSSAEFKRYFQWVINTNFPTAIWPDKQLFTLVDLMDVYMGQAVIETKSVIKDGIYKWVVVGSAVQLCISADDFGSSPFKFSMPI